MLLFEREDAAVLSIENLLDSIFGASSNGNSDAFSDSEPTTGVQKLILELSGYRELLSDLDHSIQLNSLKIVSLRTALLQALVLQEKLESRRGNTLHLCGESLLLRDHTQKRIQLPIEIICKVFSYAFPTTLLGATNAFRSNPWNDVLLHTTLVSVRCDDVLNSSAMNAWKAESIANTNPAALSLVARYDHSDNSGAEMVEAITPHLGRCRMLELMKETHDSCEPLQKAVKIRNEKLRLDTMTMNTKHARCMVGCVAASLVHLYLEDTSFIPIYLAQDLLCILSATPNLLTLSLACEPLVFKDPSPTERIPLHNLNKLRLRTLLHPMLSLITFLSNATTSPAIHEFHPEFVHVSRSDRAQEALIERFTHLMDEKYPQLTHLSLHGIRRERPMESSAGKYLSLQRRILEILNKSALGSDPFLPHLSCIAIEASETFAKPGLLEDFARNRSKNPLTTSLSSLVIHPGDDTFEFDLQFKERIQMYYPNVTFAV